MNLDYYCTSPTGAGCIVEISPDALRAALTWADSDGNADFRLGANTPDEAPYLRLVVAEGRWYLWFVPDDGSTGFHSLGDSTCDAMRHMPAGEDIWVPENSLVDAKTDTQAAVEFLATGKLPTSLEWFEL